jgi:hypothetical protein
MIQILPHVPGFGERLADAITQGAGAFGAGYLKQMENQRSQQALADVANPQLTPLARFRAYGNLTPELQKNLAQPFSSLLGPEAQAMADYNQFIREGGNPADVGLGPQGAPAPQPPNGVAPAQAPQGQPPPQPTNQSQVAPTQAHGTASIADRSIEDLTKDLRYSSSKNPYQKQKADLAKAEIERRNKEEEKGQHAKEVQRKEDIEFHKETQKYDEDLIQQNKVAKKQIEAIDTIEESINSGNVIQASAANLFKGFGKVGDKVSEWLKNPDQAKFEAAIPQLLEGWKDVFGVRLTDADLRILQDKLPSLGKSPEANRAVVGVLRKYADQNLLRGKISSEIKSANGGLRPLGYADQIERRFDEMVAPVSIISPNTGKVIQIPAYRLSDAINSGAKLANE